MSAAKPIGVGIAGAGPVVQAIHLPTLARMADLFTIVHIMDVSPTLAESVAGRTGARHSTSFERLLDDPEVEVIAVCSPQQFHAEQVIAAMRGGKRAILCEKPYATSPEEAHAIAMASAETGVPVVVGTMHVFDPAWIAAVKNWGAFAAKAHTIRSSIVLPMNDRFEDWATEVVGRPAMNFTPPGEMTPEIISQTFHALILGLAVHNLPHLRALLPDFAAIEVLSARQMAPVGYIIDARAGERAVQLIGTMHGHCGAYWEFEAISEDQVLHIRFTPSFVHTGSATATIHDANGARQFGPFAFNGYEGEWRALHALVHGEANAAPAQATLIDDLRFAVDITAKASARAIKDLGK